MSSKGINKVILIGHIGQPPVLRHTQQGTPVVNFTLATNEVWKSDGETRDRTTWHNIVMWGNVTDVVMKYTDKGSQVYLEGKLRNKTWEKDGVTHRTMETHADQLIILKGKRDDAPVGEEFDGDVTEESDADYVPF